MVKCKKICVKDFDTAMIRMYARSTTVCEEAALVNDGTLPC